MLKNTDINDCSIYRAWMGCFTDKNPYLCMRKSQQVFKSFNFVGTNNGKYEQKIKERCEIMLVANSPL
jgi:hypothetical protein